MMYTGCFKTGNFYMTVGIASFMKDSRERCGLIEDCVRKYINRDWGATSEEGRELNNEAVKNRRDRIFATYEVGEEKVFIITEADRSATTVLLASEY